jgi:hypothetical protein
MKNIDLESLGVRTVLICHIPFQAR